MGKLRLFIDNFLIYGVGGMINKIIPMLMLPILTRVYPNAVYLGLNDMNSVLISFVGAISMCGMYDAVFRLFYEKDVKSYRVELCSNAIFFVLLSTLFCVGILIIWREFFAVLFFGSKKYQNLVIFSAIGLCANNLNTLCSAPTRMENKRVIFIVTNGLSSLLAYSIALSLIGKKEYLIAMPLGTILSGLITGVFFFCLNRKWFSVRYINFARIKELLYWGVSYMPNFFIYWVYNSADRIMIGGMIGTEAVGMYGVAARIGSISNLIYTAFSGGWLFFSYSNIKDKYQIEIQSLALEYLLAISVLMELGLLIFVEILFKMIFPDAYYNAYIISPYLFLAPLLLMLIQVEGSQFSIIKKTYRSMASLIIGGVFNIVFNFVLIRKISIEGAAIATLIGYIITFMIRSVDLKLKKQMYFSGRVYKVVLILFICIVMWRLFLKSQFILNGIFQIIGMFTVIILYRKEILLIYKKKFRER